MTKKMFMAFSMMVVFAVSSSVVYGYGGGHRGGGGGHNNCGGHRNGSYESSGGNYDRGYGHRGYNGSMSSNNMTTEDKAKYDALYQKFVPKMDTLRDQIVDQRNIINTEYSKTTPNLTTINKAIDESSKLGAEMRKLRAEYSIEMEKLFPRNSNNRRY